MLRLFSLTAGAATLAATIAAAGTYAPDPGHTEVQFFWDHAGVAEQHGEFLDIDGSVAFDADAIDATEIAVTIAADSISTGVAKLDEHLRSADFFEVETHPEIRFQSTSVTRTGAETARIEGDLTMKGVTKPVTLHAEIVHQGPHPLGQFLEAYEGEWIGVRAEGWVLRSEWGLGYGTPLTSDAIRIRISSELKAE